jgi:hypothetical protein
MTYVTVESEKPSETKSMSLPGVAMITSFFWERNFF